MYQIHRVDRGVITRLWEKLHNSKGVFLDGPGRDLQTFARFLQDSAFFVQGEGFTLTFDTTKDPSMVKAHGFIYGMQPIRDKSLIREAFKLVQESFNLRRIEITFPYQVRQLHVILREVGFSEEGRLRAYFDWNNAVYDAALYSLVREGE